MTLKLFLVKTCKWLINCGCNTARVNGVSVCKKIWEECGSPTIYNDKWEKFGDRVGWRSNGNWRAYPDLTFDINKTLPGEFPAVVLSVGRGGGIGSLAGLLFLHKDL